MSAKRLAAEVFGEEPPPPPVALRPRNILEAAKELGLNVITIRRLIQEGALPRVPNTLGLGIDGRAVVEFWQRLPAWKAEALNPDFPDECGFPCTGGPNLA